MLPAGAEEGRIWYDPCMPLKTGMYRGERVEQKRSSKLVGSILVFAFLVIAAAWFVFRSGFFDAPTIGIEGLRILEQGDVEREVRAALEEESAWKPWRPTNILFIDEAVLESRLKERLFADNVTVDKSYPDILRLKIEERQRSVVLVSNAQTVLVDTSGVVTGYAEGDVLSSVQDRVAARSLYDDASLPVIQMPTDDPLAPGFQIASPDRVKLWIEICRILFSKGIRIHFMKISASESDLGRFVTEGRYELRMDLSKPAEDQIEAYMTYLRTTEDPNITEYIDVRVPAKIFVK